MSRRTSGLVRKWMVIGTAAATLFAWAPPSQARVTKIRLDPATPLTGQDIPYERIAGRAWGELDPADPQNALITDIALAPQTNGKVTYISSFFIVKPVNMGLASGMMWHDVPNRGGRITITADLRNRHDVGLSSAWQGDNAGATAVPANAEDEPGTPPFGTNEWVKVPVLTGVTGQIVGRIVNRSGLGAQPLNVMGNPIPYFPADWSDNAGATLTTHTHETITGDVTVGGTIPNADWKFCGGGTFLVPVDVTTLPVRLCLKNGFDATKLYQLVYTVKDPYVLGVGTAAFRDVGSFFRYQAEDDFGTANPLAGSIKWSIVRGSSQSGNFTRHFIHLGMNQDEEGRVVHEGAWPLIAGRRVANNSRWGQPDGVLELYQMGSEGPQWWHKFPDHVRGLPPAGILDRCQATNTCPKIVETFGGAEVFALKMTTSWVGTSAHNDIPLPKNVRRYYLPSSTHGGGDGSTTENPAPASAGNDCPGNNWGRRTLTVNPVPATGMVNRMRAALRDWLMTDTPPPPSRWPMMKDKNLVAPTKAAMGFPSGVPGIPDSIFLPENFVFPVLDYDWGPEYDHSEASGNPTNAPPPINHVIKTLVPRVDKDGNEIGGIPTVQRDAPLGTYLGWNITAGPDDATYDGRPFHKGQVCNYVGGMVPFFKKKADRLAAGDPRLSLEERYVTHAGYVAAVTAAANNAHLQGYLLAADRDALIAQAVASDVCNQPGDGGMCNPTP
jgi:alpha/beta hydrolase family protein